MQQPKYIHWTRMRLYLANIKGLLHFIWAKFLLLTKRNLNLCTFDILYCDVWTWFNLVCVCPTILLIAMKCEVRTSSASWRCLRTCARNRSWSPNWGCCRQPTWLGRRRSRSRWPRSSTLPGAGRRTSARRRVFRERRTNRRNEMKDSCLVLELRTNWAGRRILLSSILFIYCHLALISKRKLT